MSQPFILSAPTGDETFDFNMNLGQVVFGSEVIVYLSPTVTEVNAEISVTGLANSGSALAEWAFMSNGLTGMGSWQLDDSDGLIGDATSTVEANLNYFASENGKWDVNVAAFPGISLPTQRAVVNGATVSEVDLFVYGGATIYTANDLPTADNDYAGGTPTDVTVSLFVDGTNFVGSALPPRLTDQTPKQTWTQGQHVSLTLPANTFTDPLGQPLTYSAAIPSWLTFNAATWTFSGTVPSTQQSFVIQVTATDTSKLSASELFEVIVNPGAKPQLSVQTQTQTWTAGQHVSFTLASGTFTDTGNLTMAYSATVPSWLTFNATNRTFTGTVPATQGNFSITVTATDTGGASASESFTVDVGPATTPQLTQQTPTQKWSQGATASFTLPAGTFADPLGEPLTLSASAPASVTSWLKFNPATATFSGAVPTNQTSFSVTVTATDTSGLSVADTFEIDVAGDSGPVVSKQTATQTWSPGSSVVFALPSGTFTDPDNEALTYTASAPTSVTSWLSFNPATQAFSGTVPAGQLDFPLTVTATNTSGTAVSETFEVDITGAPPPGTQAITITGAAAGQATPDTSTIKPFPNVIITDPNGGTSEVVTVTLSNPANGTLSLPGSGSYNAVTGVYSFTGGYSTNFPQDSAAFNASASLELLVFTPTPHQAAAGQTVTTTFTITVTDPVGATGTNTTTSVVATESAAGPNPSSVTAAYQAILRTAPTSSYASQMTSEIASGQTTYAALENSLITGTQAQQTTIPALTVYDAFYGATENSGGLDYVTNSDAAALVSAFTASKNPDVEEAVYSTLGSWFALGANNFATLYNLATVSDTTYVDDVFQNVYGTQPVADTQTYLLGALDSYVSGATAAGLPNAALLGRGALYGDLLYDYGRYQTGKYYTAATDFLQAAANGTVTYGPELTSEFPAATSASGVTASATSMALADPAVTTITGSNQLIDPGAGSQTIQFLAGTGDDTLVLHLDSGYTVSGFAASDMLDIGSLLSETNLDPNTSLASLGNYLTIVDQGGDALVNFDPSGQGGGGTVAVLQGLGDVVTGLDSLFARGSIRIA